LKALILSGELEIETDGTTTHCGAGEVFHLRQSQPHFERYGPAGVSRYGIAQKQPDQCRFLFPWSSPFAIIVSADDDPASGFRRASEPATEFSMLTTPSETARHARAELEAIIASLRLGELAALLELGRRLVAQADLRDR
jgi:hypothetical protein